MDTPFELDEEQKKITSKILPYLKALTYEILISKPKNITSFMIDFLTRQGNYTSSGLTFAEKKELELLRNTVKYYREIDSYNKKEENNKNNLEENSDSEQDEDLMNSSDEEKIEKKVENFKIEHDSKSKRPKKNTRVSVSAEVYGIFNKKKVFVPKKIPKTPEQINQTEIDFFYELIQEINEYFKKINSLNYHIIINEIPKNN